MFRFVFRQIYSDCVTEQIPPIDTPETLVYFALRTRESLATRGQATPCAVLARLCEKAVSNA